MTREDTVVEENRPDSVEEGGSRIEMWKVAIFALLAIIIIFILLGLFRFLLVGSYGGV